MKRLTFAFVIISMIAMSGCSGMTRTQQTTLSGGAIGAGAGAALGAIVGRSPVTGAIVGGTAGAITGYFIGEQHKRPSSK